MRERGTLLTLLIVGSVVASAVFGAGTVGAASSDAVFLSIDTTTSPDQPTTEEEFDLHATITSASASNSNAYISRVSLVNTTEGEKERYDTAYSIGQVSPGGSVSETLTVELEEERVYELFLDITVNTGNRTYHVFEPVTIRVYDGHPVVGAQAAQAMPGTFTDLEVTVGNGLDEKVRNVELSLESDAVEIEQPRRVVSGVDAGESQPFTFRAKVGTPGEKEIRATIRYTTQDGDRRHVTRTLSPAFSMPEFAEDVTVAGEVAPTVPGSPTTLNLTVSNGLDVSLRQLQVQVSGEDVDVPQPQRVSGEIPTGETRTYQFEVTRDTAGTQDFDVQLSYITENGASQTVTKTVQTAFRDLQDPGEVTLTGIQVEKQGDTLAVSGTASNVGGGDVSGVTISVGESEDVRPGRSQSEFFVGTIESSDFVSFDVNAIHETNASTAEIPLVVSYTIDGVRQEEAMSVQYEAESQTASSGNDGGLPMAPLLAGVVVLIVAIAGVVYWRRR